MRPTAIRAVVIVAISTSGAHAATLKGADLWSGADWPDAAKEAPGDRVASGGDARWLARPTDADRAGPHGANAGQHRRAALPHDWTSQTLFTGAGARADEARRDGRDPQPHFRDRIASGVLGAPDRRIGSTSAPADGARRDAVGTTGAAGGPSPRVVGRTETTGGMPSPVPVPASLPLLLAGFGVMGILRRRRA